MTHDLQVLALARYGRLGASSRVRMYQYLPALNAMGIHINVQPLLSDQYVRDLYAGRMPGVGGIARGYAGRIATVLKGGAGVIWLEKELLPWLPHWLERLLLARATRVVVDYDDAVWLRYQEHASALVRGMLGGKLPALMRRADHVMAGNGWLAAQARQWGCRAVSVLPSVVDPGQYPVRADPPADGRPVIGWIGSPATVQYLELLGPVLKELSASRPIRFVCVGAECPPMPGVDVESRPWTEATQAADIRTFHVGVMPLRDGNWEQGKCGYKLLQYMASGVPVVASRVGANREIVADGVDGMLAATGAEWLAAFHRLLDDPRLARQLAAAARAKVEREYCVARRAPELAAILRGARGGAR